MTRPIEGQRPHMDGLTRLIDRFLCREQNGGFLFQSDLLCLLSLAERRAHDVAQVESSGESGGKTELRACRAPGIDRAGIQRLRLLPRRLQFDSRVSGGYRGLVPRFGDHEPDGCRSPAYVRSLSQYVNRRTSQNPRNRRDASQRCRAIALIKEPVAKPVPYEVVGGERGG